MSNYGYEGMSVDELRRKIADLNKELHKVVETKKEWVKGVNDALKEIRDRISEAVGALEAAELEAKSKALDEAATTLIEKASQKA